MSKELNDRKKTTSCGCGDACGPSSPGPGRSKSLQSPALEELSAGLRPNGLSAGSFEEGDIFHGIVPIDKKLDPDWMASLTRRGEPSVVTGEALQRIGMPVGGLFCGTVYLAGDGRLWLWDIFNRNQEGVVPLTVEYAGKSVRSRDGSAYVKPPVAPDHREIAQGFALCVGTGDDATVRTLDSDGFKDVRFVGQYPIGKVAYRDADLPVEVDLEAFSPFIPLDTDDSSLPVTLFDFRLRNTGSSDIDVQLSGWLENAVCHDHRFHQASRTNRVLTESGLTCVLSGASHEELEPINRPDRNMEDLRDFGTMALGLLGPAADDTAARALPGDFDGAELTATVPINQQLVGRIGRRMTLRSGEEQRVTFVIAWHFPNLRLLEHPDKRHYLARFEDAKAVTRYVAENSAYLMGATRHWHKTWYDSTLPYWFLDRVMAATSCLATTTAHRFENGRFWGWEGIGCCPGTCTHVWQYAQAMARLFPDVERDHRERVDFGSALTEDGVIRFRAEDDSPVYAIDGQAGRILGAYREHQMSADDTFLKRIWPQVKLAMDRMIRTDGNGDGLLLGPLHNTLDADWHGLVPWINGLYHAALRAAAEMADEMNDANFSQQCRELATLGRKNLERECWSENFGYYVHIPSKEEPGAIGVYDGCHIDQVFGAAWGRQVGLTGIMTDDKTRQALTSLWKYNFTPDVGPYREVETAGRWYAMPGDGGLLMATFPFTRREEIIGRDHWSFMYLNECMSGFEHQVAAHMVWEGMVLEGLAITRAIHDRYRAELRNPYNEVECSDHYARAMASHGTLIAACGYEYHGPKGYIAFAPRLTPEHFRAPFTAAEGWGTYAQTISGGVMNASLKLESGRLKLQTVALALPNGTIARAVSVNQGKVDSNQKGERLLVQVPETAQTTTAGNALEIHIQLASA